MGLVFLDCGKARNLTSLHHPLCCDQLTLTQVQLYTSKNNLFSSNRIISKIVYDFVVAVVLLMLYNMRIFGSVILKKMPQEHKKQHGKQ